MKKDFRLEYILELIEKFPDTSKRRLGFIANSERADLFATPELARDYVRKIFGKKGDFMLKYKKREDNPRKGSKIYSMPKSKAEEWTPYEVKGSSVAILCDIHFPKHDEKALETAVKHILKNGEPKVLILNGDIADAEEFSTWSKNPRALDSVDALNCVRQGLLYLRNKFKNSKIIYKYGNHEERLDKYCWSKAPELVGLPHISWEGLIKIDNELKNIPELEDIVFVGDQRPIMVGKLPVFHGHELPKIGANSVNPARNAFLKIMDATIVGHHHKTSKFTQVDWRHNNYQCWTVGCLCNLNPSYARINTWNYGHATVEVSRTGNYKVNNYRYFKNGEVVVVDE
jgi:predicted phosphodiesterase